MLASSKPLIDLTSHLTNPTVGTHSKLRYICNITSNLIEGANRVSLWRFNDNKTKIICVVCFDSVKQEYTYGQEINKIDVEPYFNEILTRDVINAPNARINEFTRCFTDTYFLPNNIFSLLDFILHKDFLPHGVICCESVDKEVEWSSTDIENLRKIARASSMYFNIQD